MSGTSEVVVFFWAIEFVADKETKAPLDPMFKVADRLHDKGMKPGYDIALFHATGSANSGWGGDHVLLAPPYIVDKSDIEEIVNRVVKVVEDVFEELPLGTGRATLKRKEVECAHIEGKKIANRNTEGLQDARSLERRPEVRVEQAKSSK